jgi:eukaryotic-like serine/threonine-protein kinase
MTPPVTPAMANEPDPDENIFAAALQWDDPAERAAYLDEACAGRPDLRARVEALLRASSEAQTFLERPVGIPRPAPEAPSPTVKLGFNDLLPDAEGPGTRIGRYKLLQQIGEGGCGTVFMAEQEEPVRRRVALKVIKLGMDTKSVVARFEAERQALAMMDHPNIAKVLDAGATDSGRPFFVMELVRGIPITRYCDENKLDTQQRLDLFIKVCQAIQHAHQKGIIHRDIKPSNILVTLHDGVPVPKVIDFGIAKATEGRLTNATLFTAFEQFIGTPAYMSPEQAEMSGLDIDTRADIYALGVLLYELLTGKTPFDAKELVQSGLDAMRKTIREKEPERPSTRLSTMLGDTLTATANAHGSDAVKLLRLIRGDLDWIVMKCLEKDRIRRYDTANGLAADLKRHLNNEPVIARPPSTAYRFQKAFRRNKLAFAAAGAVALALVLGAVGSGWQAVRATQASKAETRQRLLAEAAQSDAQSRQREAEAQRTRAESEQQRADAQARKALDNQQNSRRLLYAADMNLAQQALSLNNLGRTRRLLDRHRPAPGDEDLRGWEWRYLWQQCQGSAFVQLTRRPSRGFSVSFSSDGSQLAVGYLDGRIELWDVHRRALLKELNQKGPPGHVAFSPRSNLLATSAGFGELKLHDLAGGRDTVLRTGALGAPAIRDLSFTPDGSRLLAFTSGSGEPSAVLFDVAQGIALRTNATSGGNMHMGIARLSSDRQRLYLSNDDTGQLSVKCLAAGTGTEIWAADIGTDYGVTAMALSPDDKVLVTGTGYEDGTIRVWNAETGKLVARLEGHTGWVGEVTFSRDGRWLASAATDQTVRLWETSGWTEARVFRGHEDEVYSVAFSPDGRMLASASKDGAVLLWNVAAPSSNYGYRLLSSEVHALAEYTPGLAIALGADSQGPRGFHLRLADMSETQVPTGSDLSTPFSYLAPNVFAHYEQTNVLRVTEYREVGKELLRETVGPHLVRHTGTPQAALAYGLESRLIAWGEAPDRQSGSVHVVDLDEPARRWQWTSELMMPTPLAFSPDGKLLVVAGWQQPKRMELREVTTGRLVLKSDIRMETPEYQPRTRFADAGRKLVTTTYKASDRLEVVFWDLTRPEQPPKRFTERGNASGLSVSPDGRWVAVGTEAGIVALYDAVTMERSHILHGNMQAVFSVAFSPDSRSLATGAGGREAIKLWHVETGQELLTLPGKGILLQDIAFAEDGNTLLLGRFRTPGSWQMWRAPSWAEIAAAEAKGKQP